MSRNVGRNWRSGAPAFQERDVRLAAHEAEQAIMKRHYALATTIPSRRRRQGLLARGMEATNPAYGAGDADSEMLGAALRDKPPSTTESATRSRSSSESAIVSASSARRSASITTKRFRNPPRFNSLGCRSRMCIGLDPPDAKPSPETGEGSGVWRWGEAERGRAAMGPGV